MRSAVRPPSRIYYGWILVSALSLTEMTSWGVLYYAFTVFLKPMQTELGWSRGATTGAYSLALILSGVAGLAIGRWIDRHGTRLLMTAGSCAAAALVLAWSRVESLTALYLIWAGIGVVMAAVLYEPALAAVAIWFRRKRGRALTLLTFVAGFASVIYVPLAGWLVQVQGWRMALVTLAIILAAGTIPLQALFLRNRPQDMGLLPDGATTPAATNDAEAAAAPERSVTMRTALHGTQFWFLAAAFFLFGISSGAVFVHLDPYLTGRGYSPGFAASVVGLIGLVALPGRLLLTPLGDYISRSLIAAAIFLLQTAGLLVLLLVHSTAGVFGFAILYGFGFGSVTPARAALVADYYGPAFYASINSAIAICLTGARGIAPVAAGVIFDLTGGYTLALWGLVAVESLAVVAVLMAGHQARQARLSSC